MSTEDDARLAAGLQAAEKLAAGTATVAGAQSDVGRAAQAVGQAAQAAEQGQKLASALHPAGQSGAPAMPSAAQALGVTGAAAGMVAPLTQAVAPLGGSGFQHAMGTVGQAAQATQSAVQAAQSISSMLSRPSAPPAPSAPSSSAPPSSVPSSSRAPSPAAVDPGPPALPEADFTFESQGDPDGFWRVREARVREGISELYEATIELVNDDLHADPMALLGHTAVFTITRDQLLRRVCGVVRRVEDRGSASERLVARVVLVPALHALGQRSDSRIFQALTAIEIVQEVLRTAGLYQDSLSLELNRPYPTREYCVQYRETDLAFVMRLLASEGVTFHFTHVDDTETLVLVDEVNSYPAIATMGGAAVPVAGPESETAKVETVRRFERCHELRPTGVTVRDFDFTRPQAESDMTRARPRANLGERPLYEYPARSTIGNYSRPAYTRHDTLRQADLRLEEERTGEALARGFGNVTGLLPGATVEIAGHGRPELDRRWIVTRVEHVAYAPEVLRHELGTDTDPDGPHALAGRPRDRYANRFECVPDDAFLRPPRSTPRPIVEGPQTAMVVGPAGEEIYTDEHGRVKVQFHWDRQGHRDDQSSCWIRVAQAWAGGGWGFVFLPRIGMEVIVTFLEGDPDRPLVTGCVYNGLNTPPYPLPDEKTKSTLKTSSTPGNGGHNELRFEDGAGHEEVYVHAQKDMNEVVEHDHTTTVHRHQVNTIDVNHTESVGGNQSLSVTGNRTKSVTKNETTTVQGTRTETVTKLEKITLNDQRETTIAKGDKLTVTTGNHAVTVAAGNDTHDVTGNKTDHVTATYKATADVTYELHQGGTTLTLTGNHAELDAASWIKLHHNSGVIDVEESGKIKLSSAPEIELSVGGCNVSLKDGKITIVAPTEILLQVGGSAIKLDASGVTTAAAKITASAKGIQEITGALVKIN